MTIGRRTNYPPPSHGVTTMLDPSGPSSSSIDKLGSSFVTRAGKALRQSSSPAFYFNTIKTVSGSYFDPSPIIVLPFLTLKNTGC